MSNSQETTFARITFQQSSILEDLKRLHGLKNHRQALDLIIKENQDLKLENQELKDLEKNRQLKKLLSKK